MSLLRKKPAKPKPLTVPPGQDWDVAIEGQAVKTLEYVQVPADPEPAPSRARHKISKLLARGGYISDTEKLVIARLCFEEIKASRRVELRDIAIDALKVL